MGHLDFGLGMSGIGRSCPVLDKNGLWSGEASLRNSLILRGVAALLALEIDLHPEMANEGAKTAAR